MKFATLALIATASAAWTATVEKSGACPTPTPLTAAQKTALANKEKAAKAEEEKMTAA